MPGLRQVAWYWIGFVSAFVCMAWTPLPNNLLARFEHATLAPAGGLDAFVGVLVPGGHVDRIGPAVELALKYPQLRVVYTHGTSAPGKPNASGLPVRSELEQFFLDSFLAVGIPESRLLFERAATNTRENAVLSAGLEGVDITQPWLLATSAAHMPRAVAAFRTVGWNVTAYPVDYMGVSRAVCSC
jgi:uncharacterized SAM-binding protein YcdF (DUF218 family)